MRTQINNTLLLGGMILSAFAMPAFAQEAAFNPTLGASIATNNEGDVKKARFGFKASPNFGWIQINEGRLKSNGTSLGFSYGIMADFNIGGNESYWVGTELIISSMPGKVAALDTLYNTSTLPAPGAPFSNAQFDYKLQYVQLPVTLKLKTHEIGKFIYWGQFGLSPSIMIQNKVSTNTKETFYESGTTSHSPNSESNDPLDFKGPAGDGTGKGAFQDNVIPLRMSMVIGAGIEFKISGRTSVVAGLRFDNGFTDLFWDKAVKGRNNYLAIQAGIFF